MMARAVVEPKSPVDAFNPGPDESVLVHTPESVRAYRDAAALTAARQSSGLPPAGSATRATPAPGAAPGVQPVVARQVLGRHLGDLRGQAARLERELSVAPFGPNGQQIPYLVAQRAQAAEHLEALTAEIDRLSGLSESEACTWAASYSAANPGRVRI
jgi:hypothetical protein